MKNYKNYFLLIFASVLMGVVGGTVGAAFYYTLHFANSLRGKYPWLIYLLLFGGVFTVLLCKLLKVEKQGINTVFAAVKNGERVSLALFPAVFSGTVVTQLFGGSAGKEGAALQIGGSISSFFARKFGFKGEETKVLLLCGFAAVFSAVFTAPLTALAFSLEIIFISRRFYFKALIPVTASSILAYAVARVSGISKTHFTVPKAPQFSFKVITVVLACVLGAILFCLALHSFDDIFKRIFKNKFLRISVGSILIIGLTLLAGNQNYNGGGMDIITEVLKTGNTVWFAFLLKILFTSITNAAGFKGGEIVPALFIGATLGAAVGGLIGYNPVFSAAIGMIVLFCGATKCTATSIMLGFEFFGPSNIGYFVLASIISRLLTFNIGLYTHNKNRLL